MAYFPMFVDLKNKNILIVGGGKVALRKLEKLLPFEGYITVAAPEIEPELLSAGAADIIMKPFCASMLKGQDMVIAATDDEKLNHKIAALCKDKKIPVNVVDNINECSFIFPSVIKQGKLSIGISTSGSSPSAAGYLKDKISDVVPEYLPKVLEYLESLRDKVKKRFNDESKRAECFKALFEKCMEEKRELSEEEFENLVRVISDGKK